MPKYISRAERAQMATQDPRRATVDKVLSETTEQDSPELPLWKRIAIPTARVAPSLVGGVLGSIVAPGVGTVAGGAAGGALGEYIAEKLEGRDHINPGRILLEGGLGAIPASKTFTAGKAGASAIKGAVMAEAGQMGRRYSEGGSILPQKEDVLGTLIGAGVGGAIGKVTGPKTVSATSKASVGKAVEEAVTAPKPATQKVQVPTGRVPAPGEKTSGYTEVEVPWDAPRPAQPKGGAVLRGTPPTPPSHADFQKPGKVTNPVLKAVDEGAAEAKNISKTNRKTNLTVERKALSAEERADYQKAQAEQRAAEKLAKESKKANEEAKKAAEIQKVIDEAGLQPQPPTVSQSVSAKVGGKTTSMRTPFRAPEKAERVVEGVEAGMPAGDGPKPPAAPVPPKPKGPGRARSANPKTVAGFQSKIDEILAAAGQPKVEPPVAPPLAAPIAPVKAPKVSVLPPVERPAAELAAEFDKGAANLTLPKTELPPTALPTVPVNPRTAQLQQHLVELPENHPALPLIQRELEAGRAYEAAKAAAAGAAKGSELNAAARRAGVEAKLAREATEAAMAAEQGGSKGAVAPIQPVAPQSPTAVPTAHADPVGNYNKLVGSNAGAAARTLSESELQQAIENADAVLGRAGAGAANHSTADFVREIALRELSRRKASLTNSSVAPPVAPTSTSGVAQTQKAREAALAARRAAQAEKAADAETVAGLSDDVAAMEAMTPEQRASWIDKIMRGEEGGISPVLAARLGGAVIGGLAGGALDPLDDRPSSAALGAAAGLGLTSLATRDPGDLADIGSRLAEGAKKVYHKLPDYQRFSYLSAPPNLGLNMWVGPYGSAFMGALEHAVQGDKRGLIALKELAKVKSFAKGFSENMDEAAHLIGRAEGKAISETATKGEKLMSWPGQAMTAGDLSAKDILLRAGFSPEEAERMTLTSEPATALGQNSVRFGRSKTPGGKDSTFANLLFPFKRTATNIMEQGLERTPIVGFFAQKAKDVADPIAAQFVQQGIGGVVFAGSYAIGAQMDPNNKDTTRFIGKGLSNFAGQYSLMATLGFAAGLASNTDKNKAWAFIKEAQQALPLPSTDPAVDAAKSVVNLATEGLTDPETGKPNLPRGVIPLAFTDPLTVGVAGMTKELISPSNSQSNSSSQPAGNRYIPRSQRRPQ